MPDRHHDEQRPPSRRHAARDCHLAATFQRLVIQTPFAQDSSGTQQCHGTPDPEHSRYFNKQSVKVNCGLKEFEATQDHQECRMIAPNETTMEDVGFGQYADSAHIPQIVPTFPSTEQLVHHLLHPPAHAFLHGVLSLQWVVGALGFLHFILRESDERYILSPGSTVRTEGASLGMPLTYLEWLCGTVEHSSPTEQAMLFTQKYFQTLNDERERVSRR
ncbi:hypothetical protein E8E13_010253 [Curvularia kusanoi]|uniref:Uncharacterized protein n=1 Tax=Curvularia kusanoi TaxID=90978 RepID=A0A9P4WAK7_CURKU|nr:hypothetical protein E8E13_010253 [Curvularia kusanoi]